MQTMILTVVALALVAIPGMVVTNLNPSVIILGNLGANLAFLLIASLFYAFNKNLRNFVWRETKEWFGIGQTPIQEIELHQRF